MTLSNKFTPPVHIETISKNDVKVLIYRTIKTGTKRVFFFPATQDEQLISKTMWTTKVEAVGLAKMYLNNN